MPVKKRLSKHSAFGEYCVYELLTGKVSALRGKGYGDPDAEGRDIDAMRSDWAKYGDALTAWWVGETTQRVLTKPWLFVVPGGPGSRPWGWWEFDAPEDQREDETEVEYLRRHGLLRPGEEARLAACKVDGKH